MLGDKIKSFRQKKGYTQEELASKLHVTRQTISKWEKNYSVPDAILLVRLAEIFEISANQLLDTTEVSDSNVESEATIAQQLGNIAEQMAIKNRRTGKVLKIIGILIFVVIFVYVLFLIFLTQVFSNKNMESFGYYGQDGYYTIKLDETKYVSVVEIEYLSDEQRKLLNKYDLDNIVDQELIKEQFVSTDSMTLYKVKGVKKNDILIVIMRDSHEIFYAIKSI
jgi:putative transcriptional regulator